MYTVQLGCTYRAGVQDGSVVDVAGKTEVAARADALDLLGELDERLHIGVSADTRRGQHTAHARRECSHLQVVRARLGGVVAELVGEVRHVRGLVVSDLEEATADPLGVASRDEVVGAVLGQATVEEGGLEVL